MVGVMVTFQRAYARTVVIRAPNPVAATVSPRFCRRLLDTPGQVWLSLLWGSLLLSLGSWFAQDFVCALHESVSPVLWKVMIKSHQAPVSLGLLSPFAGFPGWEICCGP